MFLPLFLLPQNLQEELSVELEKLGNIVLKNKIINNNYSLMIST